MGHKEASQVYISLIIPTFNEEARILKSLNHVLGFFGSQPYSAEVIIVDDGSEDRTVQWFREHFGGHSNVRIHQNSSNLGKGEAVKQGMLLASGKFLFFSDADLSVPIETLPTFLSHLENHCDIAIGSRQKSGALIEVHQGFFREFMGKVFTRLANSILALHISDFTCGFKGFRKEIAKEIFSKQRVERWSFDAEILYLAHLKKSKVQEIPVTWRNDQRTKVRLWRDIISSFLGLLKIRLNHYLGRYS